jgi:hypothetical protein
MKHLLNSIYEILDFKSGALFTAIEDPTVSIKE